MAAVRACFGAYTAWLDEDISFQNYAAELGGLPGQYAAAAGGALLLAVNAGGQILGCVAMRPLTVGPRYAAGRRAGGARVCEMKRLFVYPEARGRRVSRALVRELVRTAREAGYDEMVLDTMARMRAAIGLYASEAFVPTEPYCFNPLDGVLFFSKRLDA
ncbi:hypothetical protein CDD83_4682 [Cordyceps sp. RAO-2017]|nr:hypothetical protein CDD83_4682 [Cordyceps sp. RAO-2017]